ncbi:hypothetical protein AVEN_101559-1, partial [Araneus ventricosus]
MEEGGRSRSSLSSFASSQRTLSADSGSSRRNSGHATEESFSDYTTAWVQDNPPTHHPKRSTCDRISYLEGRIDFAQQAAETLRGIFANSPEINSDHCFSSHITIIEEAENELLKLGPCPDPSCTRHHETTKDSEMIEAGQYPLPKTPTPSPTNLNALDGFRQVPPRKAARIQIEKPNSPIKTNNRFENLMD